MMILCYLRNCGLKNFIEEQSLINKLRNKKGGILKTTNEYICNMHYERCSLVPINQNFNLTNLVRVK